MTERQVLDYLQFTGTYLAERGGTVFLEHQNVSYHVGVDTFNRMKAKDFIQNNGGGKWTLTQDTIAMLHTSKFQPAPKFRVPTHWIVYPALTIILVAFTLGIGCKYFNLFCSIFGQ